MLYTIWCILSGEDSEFPVEFDESKTVAHLKQEIMAKCPHLASVPAFKLDLYRIDLKLGDEAGALPLRDRVEMKMKELKEKGESPLRPSSTVNTYYPTELEGDMVQIFVQLPLVQTPKGESIHSRACGAVAETLMVLMPGSKRR